MLSVRCCVVSSSSHLYVMYAAANSPFLTRKKNVLVVSVFVFLT